MKTKWIFEMQICITKIDFYSFILTNKTDYLRWKTID